MNNCLQIYFAFLSKVASLIPPPYTYILIKPSGYPFRNIQSYTSTQNTKGILLKAIENLQICLNLDQQNAIRIINDYLRFENRYVIESTWIAQKNISMLHKAFNTESQTLFLKKSLFKKSQFIGVTFHTANMFLMAALTGTMLSDTATMLAQADSKPPYTGSPLHIVGLNMINQWRRWQTLIPASMQAARWAIESGKSVIMACDVPATGTLFVDINMWNRKITVPAGYWKLANDYNVPVVAIISWTETPFMPYKIAMQEFVQGQNAVEMTNAIFHFAQNIIEKNPSCWLGWLYWHSLTNQR